MSKLIVLVGLPGCGKSTYCRTSNMCIVSSDAIRKELTGDEATQINPRMVFDIAYSRVLRRVALGQDVVLDATNLGRKHRINLLKQVSEYDVEKICIVFTTPVETCILRDSMRDRIVGKEVILRMASKYQKPNYNEGWDLIEYR